MDTIYQIVHWAQNTRYEDIPEDVIEGAKLLLKDVLGIMAPGTTADGIPEASNLIFDWGGKEESTVMIYNRKIPAPHAAFVNSIMAHGRDYDEMQPDYIVHTGVSVIPTLLAVADAEGGVSGREALRTIALTVEFEIRMCKAIQLSLMQSGWIYSGLLGHFSAAFCAGLLMDLSEEQMVNALGIVFSQMGGIQQAASDTALTKRMQPAFGCRNGVFSAYLARKGITGVRNLFDGKYNFFRTYMQDQVKRELLTDKLGEVWHMNTLAFKPYPVCGLALGGASSIKMIMEKNRINWKDITDIELGITDQCKALVVEPEEVKFAPKTVVDAQFSLPFATAAMAVRGHLLLSDVNANEGGAINDPDVRKVLDMIAVHKDEELEKNFSRGVPPTRVTVQTKSGSYTDWCFPKGNPANPFTKEDMKEKYMDCMQYGIYKTDTVKAEEILHVVDDLETVEDLRELIRRYNDCFIREW